MKLSLFIVSFHLALLISCIVGDSQNVVEGIKKGQNNWCVVTVSATDAQLQAFLDSTCNQLDCKAIRPGGSCYNPNTLQNHASYVLNLYYRARGVCISGLGTLSVNDPSFGSCRYT